MPYKPATHKPAQADTARHGDQQRKERHRLYGYKWQQARRAFLIKHSLCTRCQDKGRIEPATEVDHIIPHKGDLQLFWLRSNWQALCKTCHSEKTATEDGGWGR